MSERVFAFGTLEAATSVAQTSRTAIERSFRVITFSFGSSRLIAQLLPIWPAGRMHYLLEVTHENHDCASIRFLACGLRAEREGRASRNDDQGARRHALEREGAGSSRRE